MEKDPTKPISLDLSPKKETLEIDIASVRKLSKKFQKIFLAIVFVGLIVYLVSSQLVGIMIELFSLYFLGYYMANQQILNTYEAAKKKAKAEQKDALKSVGVPT